MKNLISLALLILMGCSNPNTTNVDNHTTTAINEGRLIHNVYFWVKPDVSDEKRAAFEKALEELAEAPSIEKYYWGKPAKTKKRPITDNTYDYAVNIFFKSLEDEAQYQIDPMHLKFVNEFGPLFSKVRVYDNYY